MLEGAERVAFERAAAAVSGVLFEIIYVHTIYTIALGGPVLEEDDWTPGGRDGESRSTRVIRSDYLER